MDPGDADREELAERVEQLEQTVSKMLPDRRGVLKGLGAAAVGGAAVGGATGGASGQSGAAGGVGTPEEPVDVDAWHLDVQNGADFNGTDIENAGSLSTDKLYSDSVTMFVRSTGDDANDGLSQSSAKATLTSAVQDAPIHHDYSGRLVIDIGSDTLQPASGFSTDDWSAPKMVIRADTDEAGDPAGGFDGTNAAGNLFLVRGNHIDFQNVDFANPDLRAVAVDKGSFVSLDNCSLASDDRATISAAGGGEVSLSGGTTSTFTGTDEHHVLIQDGYAYLGDCTLDGAGSTCVLRALDGSGRIDITPDATLIGNGDGETPSLIRANGQRHLKIGDADYRDATSVVDLRGAASGIAQDGITNLTNVSNKLRQSFSGGWWSPDGDRPNAMFVPQRDDPTAPPPDINDARGMVLWNSIDTGGSPPRAYFEPFGGAESFPPMVTTNSADPDPGDLVDGELSFDRVNNRLLFKDQNDGTVHYWNTDETL